MTIHLRFLAELSPSVCLDLRLVDPVVVVAKEAGRLDDPRVCYESCNFPSSVFRSSDITVAFASSYLATVLDSVVFLTVLVHPEEGLFTLYL